MFSVFSLLPTYSRGPDPPGTERSNPDGPGATHSRGAEHPRRSALTTAPHAWSKLPLRSTLALMPRTAVAAWYGYTTTPRIQIALKAARLSYFATHVTHVKTGEKETVTSRKPERGNSCFRLVRLRGKTAHLRRAGSKPIYNGGGASAPIALPTAATDPEPLPLTACRKSRCHRSTG